MDTDEVVPLCQHVLASLPNQTSLEVLRKWFLRIAETSASVEKSASVHCGSCKAPSHLLYACLTPDCKHLGCSSRAEKHAYSHAMEAKHYAAIALPSQIIHCYSCSKDWDFGEDDIEDSPQARALSALADALRPAQPTRQSDAAAATPQARIYPPGLCGLRNLGNTCYMNAALQCLANSPPLVDYFLNCEHLYAPNADQHQFIYDFAVFMNRMWSGTAQSFPPQNILADLWHLNPLFRGFGQHDSHEAVSSFLDALHEQTKAEDVEEYKLDSWKKIQEEREAKARSEHAQAVERGKKPPAPLKPLLVQRSMISAIFEGTLRSRVHCLNCAHVSDTPQPCVGISVNIPLSTKEYDAIRQRKTSLGATLPPVHTPGFWSSVGNMLGLTSPTVDLVDCLHGFCCQDELTGTDKYNCEHCKQKQDAFKYMLISNPPEVLPIHLKRFRHDKVWGSKVDNRVSFPLEKLDLSPFCVPHSPSTLPLPKGAPAPSDASKPILYNLSGIIVHHGGLGGGHYIAFAKNKDTGRWYEFDDSSVTEVSEGTVKSQQAYVLFYTKTLSADRIADIDRIEPIRLKTTKGPIDVRFVSKFWYQKFRTLDNPGPIRNVGLLCKHYKIRQDVRKRLGNLVEALPTDVYNALLKKYGGEGLGDVKSLEACTVCLDKQALAKKREYELATIKKLDKTELERGEHWYLIPCAWLASWVNFASRRQTDEPPGKLDTNALLTADGKPLPGLERRVHYRGVTRQVWEFFAATYTAGTPIIREEIDIYGTPVEARAMEEAEEEVANRMDTALPSEPNGSPQEPKASNKMDVVEETPSVSAPEALNTDAMKVDEPEAKAPGSSQDPEPEAGSQNS